ncbi:putative signaling protein [Ferriphaselus amnicola]|uniref:Putative signaling protein n=1 Tax=Ferriphaselus amnicola TaxID=1188319 RepID=A0A2Z6G8R4_9PROT|nr:EAL domain-containing protein [Ferriphaselus amnicola]BBE49783.1 putative signaling protein [Ferriphaselus amnicola]
MQGSYDIWLVLLSIGIAVMASYIGLDMASRVNLAKRVHLRQLWLIGGTLSMGCGIWAMHFIGMLAYNLPIPVAYHIPTTLLSLLVANLVSGLTLFMASRKSLGWMKLLLTGTIMGLGIAAMHYVGMSAMQIAPTINYDLPLFSLSLIIAIIAAVAALYLAFSLRDENSPSTIWKKAGSAILMGIAIVGMHFTGMAAAVISPDSICTAAAPEYSGDVLAVIVAICSGLIVAATLLLGMLDARVARQAEKEVRMMTRELRDSEERFRTMTERVRDIFSILSPEGIVKYESPAVMDALGYEPEELIGNNMFELVHPQDNEAVQYQFERVLAGEEMIRPIEFRFRHKNGTWRILEAFARNELANPAVDGIVVHSRDITEHKQSQQTIWNLAHHDALTGLPNRSLLQDRILQAIHQAHREGHKLAVLFLDLDHFKHINDSLGHHVGDALLQVAAQRIESCLREGDTVARLGGDEFVVLLPSFQSDADVVMVADKILEELGKPFEIDGHGLHIGVSIGISQYPRDGKEPGHLMRMADAAMYHAKANGRNNAQFFTEQIDSVARERLQVENGLRLAIQQGELRLYYQPLVDLKTNVVVGMEALIRWEHPERGLLSPGSFVEIAEDTGLISIIGEWILGEACHQAKQWNDQGFALQVAINLSVRQFDSGNLHQTIVHALRQSGLPARQLKLEITESTMISNIEETSQLLERLRSLGIQIAIDDFGTGYSSLSYLKRFPIDTLKIDQSFVRDIGVDTDDEAIVTAIIAVAHSLKMGLVAEGIETERQLDFLRGLGCDIGQGYYFSKPLPPDAFTEFMKNRT